VMLTALSIMGQLPMFILMFYLSLNRSLSPDTIFILFIILCIILSIAHGISYIVSYKLPHHIMDMKDYGTVTGQSGVILGVFGVAFMSLFTFATNKLGYFSAIKLFIATGFIFFIISIIITFSYERRTPESIDKDDTVINLFKYRPFYVLLIPNFLRGFSTGIFNLMAVIGFSEKVIDSKSAVLIGTLAQIATIVSCGIYAVFFSRKYNGIINFISTVVFAVTLPFCLIGKSSTVFIIFYTVAYIFFTFVSYAIPVIVARHIDYECLGQYTAWRMGLHTLGTALGSAAVPLLLKLVGGTGTMIICGLTLLPCGIMYYLFEKNQNQ